MDTESGPQWSYVQSTFSQPFHKTAPHEKESSKLVKEGDQIVQFQKMWNKVFILACVVAVSLDPLFFYIPMIDQSNKCLRMDKKLKILAIIFRLLTDLTYVTDIIYLVAKALKRDDPSFVWKKGQFLKNAFGIARRLSWFYILVDFLAVLPVPQVAMLVLLGKDRWLSLDSKRFMNAIILAQYVPRVLRIYLSCLEFTKSSDKLAGTLWVKGAFNLFLYVLASHVLGSFWYFFSIQRQTSCWKQACGKNETYVGCQLGIYKCAENHHNLSDYKALLDRSCPINEPNATAFNFGIFLDALKSGIVESKNFPEKFFYSFWWGLRNLSSHGENLETSKYAWENCFAIAISIIGLLLFLYLIGNIQLATTRSEEIRQKMKSKMLDIDMWIEKNNLPKHLRPVIVENVQHKLEKENRDVDMENLFSLLPTVHRVTIKRHLCIKILRKVQVFQNMKESVLEDICSHLKPVTYGENSYIIRDGDPMHQMLFITQGTILAVTSSRSTSGSSSKSIFCTSSGSMKRMKKGDYHGEELLEWSLTHLSFTEFPISTANVMCHTKVEGFILKANDLLNAVKRYWWHFKRLSPYSSSSSSSSTNISHGSQVERWQLLAVSVIQALWRRKQAGKSIKPKHVNIGNLQGPSNKNHRLRPINHH